MAGRFPRALLLLRGRALREEYVAVRSDVPPQADMPSGALSNG
jgi:hypothetical protein